MVVNPKHTSFSYDSLWSVKQISTNDASWIIKFEVPNIEPVFDCLVVEGPNGRLSSVYTFPTAEGYTTDISKCHQMICHAWNDDSLFKAWMSMKKRCSKMSHLAKVEENISFFRMGLSQQHPSLFAHMEKPYTFFDTYQPSVQ